MSERSNNQGRAYEYAWMNALYEALSKVRTTKIVDNTSLVANKRAWDSVDEEMQTLLAISANSAVDTIIEMEPRMSEDDGDELFLEFQTDETGTHGDVRDIVIKRNNVNWEVGLSVKHNHDAAKHPRLSGGLDFGREWFGVPCSESYWRAVKPIFDMLKSEKKKGSKWSELNNKESDVYIPLLNAFMDEIKRTNESTPTMPEKMVEFLIGTSDYYKVVSHDGKRMTLISTFNIHDTLNKPSKIKVSAISVPIVELPTELVAIKFKTGSSNTVEMYLNNGWQLSFRIHNASTRVEPSLKFDVQFIGVPVSILKIECKWKSK